MSAPSVYQKLKQGVVDGSDRVSAAVLEYDRRFAAYGSDFVFYDYNQPVTFEVDVEPRSFDVVLADPPYLSEECLSKVAQTIKHLSKGKVLLCTGERAHFPSCYLKNETQSVRMTMLSSQSVAQFTYPIIVYVCGNFRCKNF